MDLYWVLLASLGVIVIAIRLAVAGGFFLFTFVQHKRNEKDVADASNGRPDFVDRRELMLSLMTSVMCCNGSPSVKQLDIIKEFIRTQYKKASEDKQKQMLKKVQQFMKERYTISGATNLLLKMQEMQRDKRVELMELLLKLAYADGGYDEQEKIELWRIAKGLRVDFLFNGSYSKFSNTTIHSTNSSQQRQSSGNYGGYNNYNGRSRGSSSGYQGSAHQSSSYYSQPSDWDYTLLGLTKTATNDEVKKAYRKLAMKYHPDRLTEKSEAEKKTASKKFEEITAAYDCICNQRGIK